jgi:hypothetical protein
MSNSGSKNFLVFGVQDSGKTTFAAALWHLLDSREITTTVLIKGKHQGDFRYLEKISKLWSEGWKVERTKSDEVEDVKINLRHPPSGMEMVLEFTDLAGETLEKAFATRLCPPEFVDMVRRSNGMLLFVSALRFIDDVTILDALGEVEPNAHQEAEIDNETDDPPWDADSTPRQVRIVDLLQALRLDPFARPPFKIAVIVSAWDLTDEQNADAWLSKRLPLLDQFLKNGEIATEVRVYGVSAQGGPLSHRDQPPTPERDHLLAITPASKRIRIVGHDVGPHDLTHPVMWLSGLDIRI